MSSPRDHVLRQERKIFTFRPFSSNFFTKTHIINLTSLQNALSCAISVDRCSSPVASTEFGVVQPSTTAKKLPGGISVKMKLVLILAVLALSCVAANAQTHSFGLVGYNGIFYCDSLTFSVATGGAFAFGTHDLTTVCPGYANGTMFAWKTTIPLGQVVSGGGYAFADDGYDSYWGAYMGVQENTFSKIKASSKHYGWYIVESSGGAFYFQNYGFLSNTLPTKNSPTAGVSFKPTKR
jgi:hypothetical protein